VSRTWKRSDGMSYREWGRVRKDRVLVEDWKNQLQEEQEVNKVFVIFNEWNYTLGGSGTELIGGEFFLTEGEAWDALSLIADSHQVELARDETSFNLNADHPKGIESEEYYIQELNR